METIDDLNAYLKKLPQVPTNYRVAVGSLLFNKEDKIVLIERGKKARDGVGELESPGGSLDKDETNLHKALKREICEELGDIDIQIDELLTVLILPSTKDENTWWVVPQFLCRIVSGQPTNMEPEKCERLHELSPSEIEDDMLTVFQKETTKAYREKYGHEPYYID